MLVRLQNRRKSAWSAATTPSRPLAHARAAGPWQAAGALGEALGTLPAATLSAPAGTPASSQHESGLPGCSEEARSLQEQRIGLEAGPNRTVRKTCMVRAEERSGSLGTSSGLASGGSMFTRRICWQGIRGGQPQCASVAYLFRLLPKGWKAAWGDRSPWVGR